MIDPPMNRRSAVMQSNVVAVPKSTTMRVAGIPVERAQDVHDPVGADGERLIDVERERAAASGR